MVGQGSVMQAILLGIVQGLTEFLPVSSSGHLVLARAVMDIPELPMLFDILLH
ncbi:MAG: undecaprenyl-diphosphate phosphatase, partial [Sphaerochaetaceae bacterium]